jgi:hypothetical protein
VHSDHCTSVVQPWFLLSLSSISRDATVISVLCLCKSTGCVHHIKNVYRLVFPTYFMSYFVTEYDIKYTRESRETPARDAGVGIRDG